MAGVGARCALPQCGQRHRRCARDCLQSCARSQRTAGRRRCPCHKIKPAAAAAAALAMARFGGRARAGAAHACRRARRRNPAPRALNGLSQLRVGKRLLLLLLVLVMADARGQSCRVAALRLGGELEPHALLGLVAAAAAALAARAAAGAAVGLTVVVIGEGSRSGARRALRDCAERHVVGREPDRRLVGDEPPVVVVIAAARSRAVDSTDGLAGRPRGLGGGASVTQLQGGLVGGQLRGSCLRRRHGCVPLATRRLHLQDMVCTHGAADGWPMPAVPPWCVVAMAGAPHWTSHPSCHPSWAACAMVMEVTC
eukprot:361735-Chlamydomonas_euryale.AAC.2